MKRAGRDIGVYIVFTAFYIVVAVTLIGAVIAAGFLAANKASYINAVNSASLAALERYLRPLPGATTTSQREDGAVRKANDEILRFNTLKSFGAIPDLGQLGPFPSGGTGGKVIFGKWKANDDDPSTPNDCDLGRRDKYPCFVQSSSEVNAVQIRAHTPDPFKIPFSSFLGSEDIYLNTEATAAVVPRCVVYALDTSLSTTEASHPSGINTARWFSAYNPTSATPPPDPALAEPLCDGQDFTGYSGPPYFDSYTCPRDTALFAFDLLNVVFNGSENQATVRLLNDMPLNPCRDPSVLPGLPPNRPASLPYANNQGKRWCNLSYVNGIWRARPASGPGPDPLPNDPLRAHFVDDYKIMNTVYGVMAVDTVTNPQPLYDFLSAFNAGLVLLDTQSSLSDRAKILVFKGNVFDKEPKGANAAAADPGFAKTETTTNNLKYLIQLTNPDNIKGPDPVFPNYVSRGWFGRFDDNAPTGTFRADASTNIVGALREAISLLGDQSKCPANARKSIVLATDGVMNCTIDSFGAPVCPPASAPKDWNLYRQAEDLLLYDSSSLLSEMVRDRISLTVLLAGKSVEPNYIDHVVDGKFLSYASPMVYGFGGDPARHADGYSYWFTDPSSDAPGCGSCSTPESRDKYAFEHTDEAGVVFRRPNGVFAEMAARTGGIFCPLLELPPDNTFSDYEDDDGDEQVVCGSPNCCGAADCCPTCTPRVLKATAGRGDRVKLTQSQRYLTPGQQAAMCVVETIGLNPFHLVRED